MGFKDWGWDGDGDGKVGAAFGVEVEVEVDGMVRRGVRSEGEGRGSARMRRGVREGKREEGKGGRLRVLRELININSDIITTETHNQLHSDLLSVYLSVLPIDRSIHPSIA